MNASHPNAAKDARRRDRGQLEQALRGAGAGEPRGNAIRCPFHDDQHASASIHADEHGVWRFKCFTCGKPAMDVFDVIEAGSGKPVGDQLRELAPGMIARVKPDRVFPTVESIVESVGHLNAVERVHAYTNPDTRTPDLVILRIREPDGGKVFYQYQPNPGGGFIKGAPPKPLPLYNRTKLRAAKAVVVVEGEKCVEALRAVGVEATTSPGGAKNAKHADWRPLAGLTVYLWPDNDQNGMAYMRDVAEQLSKVDPRPQVFMLDPARLELPPKGDVVDYIERLPDGEDKEDAVWQLVIEASESAGPAQAVGRRIEDMISGKWRAIDWKARRLGVLSKALFPASITLLCGDPGSTKSLLLLEELFHWHTAGIRVACYMLEDTKVFHLLRALAQMSGQSGMTDDVWIRENPDRARDIYAEYLDKLNSFGACITSPENDHPTPDQLAAWVEERCKEGYEIIAIDPITCADFSDKPWKDDRAFIWRCQRALAFSGARLILVTHPRKGAGGAKSTGAMDDMAGGAAYPRHAQTVLWVQRKDPAEDVEIVVMVGKTEHVKTERIDRVVRIVKSRNGKGHGASIGFNFFTESLTFEEVGLIRGKPKAKPVETIKDVFTTTMPVPPKVKSPEKLSFDDDEVPV
jgi:hypothetical protein